MGMASENGRGRAGPFTLPGTEGFYVLTPDGGLGRYEAEGHFTPEPSLTSALGRTIDMLLRDYRAGRTEALALGLVTAHITERPWRCASLVFSDNALREIYRSGDDPRTPLTDFQKKNRIKSLFQGMELVLDARKASQPQHPRYCPVFFVPEADAEVLGARYGVEGARPGRAFEVLDLMAPLSPDEQQDPVYARMVMEVVRSRIAPDLRSGPSLMLATGASPEIKSTRPAASAGPEAEDSPWKDQPEDRHIAFQDGDHVPYWLLAGFAPFNQLNDLQREFIARTLRIKKRVAGTTLIERGSMEDVSYFLVEGTVVLESFDGRSISVSGGTKRAQLPVSQLNPHAYTVKSETAVTLVPVSLSMLRKVTRITTTYQNRTGIEVRERFSLPDNLS